MNKLINILVVWILVFSLPVQGFAVATMMNCEKAHSHEAQSLIESHNLAMHTGHAEATNHDATHENVADTSATHHSSSSKHSCSHTLPQCEQLCLLDDE